MTTGRINQVGAKIYTARRQFTFVYAMVFHLLGQLTDGAPIRNSPQVAIWQF